MLNSPLGGRRGIGFGLGRSWQRKAGGFSPTDIAGLQLWLDFSDASTLFVDAGITPVSADGDLIYQANDKSGNNRHVTQAIEAKRPLYRTGIQNGLSLSTYDGIDDFLMVLFTAGNEVTTVFIGDLDSGTSQVGDYFYDGGVTIGNGMYIYYSTFVKLMTGPLATQHLNLLGLGIRSCFRSSGGENTCYYRDNLTKINITNNMGNVNDVAGLTLGSRYNGAYPSKCRHAEILMYSGEITDGEYSQLHTYLNNKWAIY